MYPLTNITNTRLEITLRFDYVLFIASFSMVSILCSLLFTVNRLFMTEEIRDIRPIKGG